MCRFRLIRLRRIARRPTLGAMLRSARLATAIRYDRSRRKRRGARPPLHGRSMVSHSGQRDRSRAAASVPHAPRITPSGPRVARGIHPVVAAPNLGSPPQSHRAIMEPGRSLSTLMRIGRTVQARRAFNFSIDGTDSAAPRNAGDATLCLDLACICLFDIVPGRKYSRAVEFR
jgi:hypothetical protein